MAARRPRRTRFHGDLRGMTLTRGGWWAVEGAPQSPHPGLPSGHPAARSPREAGASAEDTPARDPVSHLSRPPRDQKEPTPRFPSPGFRVSDCREGLRVRGPGVSGGGGLAPSFLRIGVWEKGQDGEDTPSRASLGVQSPGRQRGGVQRMSRGVGAASRRPACPQSLSSGARSRGRWWVRTPKPRQAPPLGSWGLCGPSVQ